MPDAAESLFDREIAHIEREKQAWDILYSKLEARYKELSGHGGGSDEYPVTDTIAGKLGLWEVSLNKPDSEWVEKFQNRWGHKLIRPINIALYIPDDGHPLERSITDDSKLTLICSPRGVLDASTGQHLDVTEVERLIDDRHIFGDTVGSS